MRPKMVLKDEGSLITISGTRVVTGPTVINSTIPPNKLVCVPLNQTNTLPGLQRFSGFVT